MELQRKLSTIRLRIHRPRSIRTERTQTVIAADLQTRSHAIRQKRKTPAFTRVSRCGSPVLARVGLSNPSYHSSNRSPRRAWSGDAGDRTRKVRSDRPTRPPGNTPPSRHDTTPPRGLLALGAFGLNLLSYRLAKLIDPSARRRFARLTVLALLLCTLGGGSFRELLRSLSLGVGESELPEISFTRGFVASPLRFGALLPLTRGAPLIPPLHGEVGQSYSTASAAIPRTLDGDQGTMPPIRCEHPRPPFALAFGFAARRERPRDRLAAHPARVRMLPRLPPRAGLRVHTTPLHAPGVRCPEVATWANHTCPRARADHTREGQATKRHRP